MPNIPYSYRAVVTDIKDGDTIAVNIDLPSRFGKEAPPSLDSEGLCDYGFGVWSIPNLSNLWLTDVTIRLALLNAKEITGAEKKEGLEAKFYLYSLIFGEEIYLETQKYKRPRTKPQEVRDPYGRYLGTVILKGVNINQRMLDEGFAQLYRP